MPWTIDFQPAREPELLNQFLLALGKATALSNAFEQKCDHYRRVIAITDALKESQDPSRVKEIATSKKKAMIGDALGDIFDSGDIGEETLDVLQAARRARNFIAHQGSDLHELHRCSARRLMDALEALRPYVYDLALGDNIVSGWAYVISEREPAPSGMVSSYPSLVMRWVFDAEGFDSESRS